MNMFLCWIVLLLALSSVISAPNGKNNEVHYVVEAPENRTYCDKMVLIKWASDFHECYFDRKYKDGGGDLENIVERMLRHAEVCTTSIGQCVPNAQGFKDIMNKVISQIKDYAEMYLEDIRNGREKIKDLECVENYLSLNSYVKCFQTHVPGPSVSRKSFERGIEEAISCVDKSNRGCSNEAKSTLDRIVKKMFGMEYRIEEIKPPATETPPPPQEKRWYDYIIQPFVSAWQYIRSFFG